MSESLELDPAALQIKAIHTRGRQQLTKAEVIELLERPMYLGVPKPIPPKTRGRKPKNARTQYDVSYIRWRGLYQRLIRLPRLRNGKGYVDHALIKQLFMTLHQQQGIPRHKLVAKVLDYFEHHPNLPCPTSSTLRKIRAAAIPNSGK